MNKGAKDFQRWKACGRKRRFESLEEAYQKGQSTYKCRYCGGWHRATAPEGTLRKLTRELGPRLERVKL